MFSVHRKCCSASQNVRAVEMAMTSRLTDTFHRLLQFTVKNRRVKQGFMDRKTLVVELEVCSKSQVQYMKKNKIPNKKEQYTNRLESTVDSDYASVPAKTRITAIQKLLNVKVLVHQQIRNTVFSLSAPKVSFVNTKIIL